MAKPILDDRLWEIIEPLLPRPKKWRRRYPGRKPVDNRKALCAILFVLKTGLPWEYLPQELGWGSGMTAWRRLHAWQKQGVWKKVHDALLAHLQGADQIDWSRAIIDSSLRACRARRKKTGPSPTDRSKSGSKHHLITDAGGIPLAATVTGANAHDVTQLLPLVEAIPPVRGKRGRPRRRPRRLQGDRAYDSQPIARRCGSEAFNQSWPSVIPNMAAVWVLIAGWSNGPSVGSINCADFAHATNAATTFTKLSSPSGVLSSVVTSFNTSFC